VLLERRDDVASENDNVELLWQSDGFELFMVPSRESPDAVQCGIAPGMAANQPAVRYRAHDHRKSPALKAAPVEFEVARTRTGPDRCKIEVRMPWSNLAIVPQPGSELAFQVYANDTDGGPGRNQLVWFPRLGAHLDHSAMHPLRLAELAGPGDRVAAVGEYEFGKRVRVDLLAGAADRGQMVELRKGEVLLAETVLRDRDDRPSATLRAPMPARGEPSGDLVIAIGGRPVAVVDLPDAERFRARLMMEQSPSFDSCVFAGESFPPIRFTQGALVDNLIGPHTLEPTFYDADGREVMVADKPGRYGAVVRIRTEDGRLYTRFRTLYRTPGDFAWWNLAFPPPTALPPEWGIPAGSIRANPDAAGSALGVTLRAGVRESDDHAVWLAGMAGAEGSARAAGPSDRPEALDRQWWVALKRRLNGNEARFPGRVRESGVTEADGKASLQPGSAVGAGMTAEGVRRIGAVLKSWAAGTDEGFEVVVARHGVIVLHRAFGERDGKPMDLRSPSGVASITKLFHGTAVMVLVDRGLVDLDLPIERHLPEFAGVPTERPVTLRELLNHTAGLWGHWGDELDDFEHRVAEYAPSLEVEQRYEYNGADLALAGKVIEQVSGLALPEFYRRHLLKPLGCADTQITNSSYDARTTALDMARLGQMLLDRGRVGRAVFLRPETVAAMLPRPLGAHLDRAGVESWGVGTQAYRSGPLSDQTFGHGSGSMSTLLIDPVNGLVVAMARNAPGANFAKYHPQFLQAVAEAVAP